MELVLNINNKNVTVNVPTDEMLLDTLRDLGYYSVRCGCDTTNCGLCNVWAVSYTHMRLPTSASVETAEGARLKIKKQWGN